MSEPPEDPKKPNWAGVKWYGEKEEEEAREKPDSLKDQILSCVAIVLLMGAGFGAAALFIPYYFAVHTSRSLTYSHRSPDRALESVAEADSKTWAITRFSLGAAFGVFWAGIYIYRASRSDKGK